MNNATNHTKIIKNIYNNKIGIFGVGNMGGALLLGFKSFLDKHSLTETNNNFDAFYLCDPCKDKQTQYTNLGFKNFYQTQEQIIFQKCKFAFICVKPDLVEGLIKRNKAYINKNHVLVSICAGTSINEIETALLSNSDTTQSTQPTQSTEINNDTPGIIRIMASHLCLINESASTYSANKTCKKEDEEIIECLLSNLGLIKKVDERKMDVFTALSGSGPAFVYQFVESLVDGALKNGVDVQTAREYAVQVVFGAAKYLQQSDEKNPASVKYMVTTPNGTTIAGLSELDKFRFKYAVGQAITKAKEKGAEIEKEKLRMAKPKH